MQITRNTKRNNQEGKKEWHENNIKLTMKYYTFTGRDKI